MNIVIIEDELEHYEHLVMLLREFLPEVKILAWAKSVAEAKVVLLKNKPDLVLSDVELPDGESFDVFAALPSLEFPIIFTTAFDKFAVKAFKFCAVDFLLKPVAPDELVMAIEKAKKSIENKSIMSQFEELKKALSNKIPIDRITVPTQQGMDVVKISNIVRCEADGSYTKFVTKENEVFVACKNIREYEDILEEFDFFRIHKSHLVCLNYVRKFNKSTGASLVLENGEEITVARRKKDELLKKLTNSI